MTIGAIPPAEVDITTALVRALLEQQHPDLADLPLIAVGNGWDNRIFRLGDRLAVRLPRRAAAAALVQHEQRWLPELAPRLPIPIPVPLRAGRPGCGFPWSWSVTPWLEGTSAAVSPLPDALTVAVQLGAFLSALHHHAPGDAPQNPFRNVPLANRASAVQDRINQLTGVIDAAAVLALWDRASTTRLWPGPPQWIHGDLHPANLLVSGTDVSAVLDFGDLTAGDPATDLSVAWTLLPPAARSTFRAAAGASRPIDDDTWTRARGWALLIGLIFLSSSQDDVVMGAMGRKAIEAALSDSD